MSSAMEQPLPPPVAESWSTDPAEYQLIAKIGQGAFASVWKAVTTEKKECAVKVLNLDHFDTNLTEIRQEVQAMRLSSHANILPCHTAFVRDTNLWLITPLMDKGSSLHCLSSARRATRRLGQPPIAMEKHIVYILHETLLGLQYIHAQGQIHRDIKAGNILLHGNGEVRIADFGVSGWLVRGGSQQEKAKTFVGTPCWMAPEVMEQIHGYDYKADIWSLGITALELAKGYAPYAKFPPMKVLILTIQEDPPSLDSYDDDDDEVEDEEWSKSFRSLVALCLQKDASKRPTCQELLAKKYFSDLNREERREQIKTQVCDIVQDIGTRGSSDAHEEEALRQENIPVSIISSAEDQDRAAGTTWVFADGSQVQASTQTASTVDDVIDELDNFGKQTGGENYSRFEGQEVSQNQKEQDQLNADLEDFMDEFEMQTGGENFRKPS